MKFLKGAAGVAAIAGAIASTSAGAVNVSKDGVGEVAISPFYTTRNNWSTLINLTNTSDDQVVVKVRLHEAYNSRDVLDFIVALSSKDVYTARIFEGAGGPVIQTLDQANDDGNITCTVPSSVGLNTDPLGNPIEGTALSTLGFDVAAPTATDIDRLREGYIEFIVMGHATADGAPAATTTTPVATAIETHNCAALDTAFNDAATGGTSPGTVAAADPESAGAVDAVVRATGILTTARQFGEPTNSVKFNARLINGTLGVEAGIPVTTWANFFNPNTGASGAVDGVVDAAFNADCLITRGDERIQSDGFFTDLNWIPGGDAETPTPVQSCQNLIAAQREFAYLEPSLADAFPVSANFFDDVSNTAVAFLPQLNRGIDAVSATITRSDILNEWSTNPAQGVATEWVATFPTKGFYVDQYVDSVTPAGAPADSVQAALVPRETNAEGRIALNREQLFAGAVDRDLPYAPFQSEWDGTNACDEFSFELYDRAERSLAQGGVVISPTPSNARPAFCFESNVITFNGITRLGAPAAATANRANINTTSLTANAGWMDLTFDTAALTPRLFAGAAGAVGTGTNVVTDTWLVGKPIIGFLLKVRTFANSTAEQNFASANEHGYSTVYQAP